MGKDVAANTPSFFPYFKQINTHVFFRSQLIEKTKKIQMQVDLIKKKPQTSFVKRFEKNSIFLEINCLY
jgi:hypothetical protein